MRSSSFSDQALLASCRFKWLALSAEEKALFLLLVQRDILRNPERQLRDTAFGMFPNPRRSATADKSLQRRSLSIVLSVHGEAVRTPLMSAGVYLPLQKVQCYRLLQTEEASLMRR